jgi:eukaryotic-like serine/threonine-protein kinase
VADSFVAPLRPGDRISGKYRIDRVLAVGGMGVVYAATHFELAPVAIKVLRPEFVHDPIVTARFVNEARAAARLQSEHVGRVLDISPLPNGSPYVVMEYLIGRDLGEVIDHEGRLPIEVAVDYVMQACDAVAEAHAAGIVHRDLKAQNLFLTRAADGSGLIKVLDFGISKGLMAPGARVLTHPTLALGSPHYMSPEQMRSPRGVDHRADIWSLGVVLYELMTGHCPFEGESLPVVCAKVQREAPEPPSRFRPEIPAELDAAVLRCLAKEPDDRYSCVAELMAALEPFARAPSPPAPARERAPSDPTIELGYDDDDGRVSQTSGVRWRQVDGADPGDEDEMASDDAFDDVHEDADVAAASRFEADAAQMRADAGEGKITSSEIPGLRPIRIGRIAVLFAGMAGALICWWHAPEIARLAESPEARSMLAGVDRAVASIDPRESLAALLSALGE